MALPSASMKGSDVIPHDTTSNGKAADATAHLSAAQKRKARQKKSKLAKQAVRDLAAVRPPPTDGAAPAFLGAVEYVSAPREYEVFRPSAAGPSSSEGPPEGEDAAADSPPVAMDAEGESKAGADSGAASRMDPVAYLSEPMEDEEGGTAGLGLGATASSGLGATAGLGAAAGLGSGGGLGFSLGGLVPEHTGDGSDGEDPEADGVADTKPGLGNFAAAGTMDTTDAGIEGALPPQPAVVIKQEEVSASEAYDDFKRIFQRFASAEQVTGAEPLGEDTDEEADENGYPIQEEDTNAVKRGDSQDGSDDEDDEDEKQTGGLSKKKAKLQSRMAIAALKQACPRPEVVEVWDVTSPDPRLLVWLKSLRNTTAVPRHWSQKRKYLQGKRGLEKPAFVLPDFIEATGIGEMRSAYKEKEDAKKLKQKQRDRMTGRMGKLDIDYQVLHDAFFKFQNKPQLTGLGEVYYEGKEFDLSVKSAKAGVVTPAMREALGMAPNAPPPWLINMQRYGPPPSYPDLPIAGLNAPIPPGGSFGYQAGGWGKPPVNEDGIPLYGDVFGERRMDDDDEAIDKSAQWGELESADEESESEEEEEEDQQIDSASLADGIASGIASGITSGIASGYGSSVPSGMTTPDVVDLRKSRDSGGGPPQQLFQVLEQQQVAVGGGLMESDHTYKVPGASGATGLPPPPIRKGVATGAVGSMGVLLDPEELDGLDPQERQQLLEERLQAQQQGNAQPREDFSDMVAAKARQQKRKAAAKAADKDSKRQKDKDFKF